MSPMHDRNQPLTYSYIIKRCDDTLHSDACLYGSDSLCCSDQHKQLLSVQFGLWESIIYVYLIHQVSLIMEFLHPDDYKHSSVLPFLFIIFFLNFMFFCHHIYIFTCLYSLAQCDKTSVLCFCQSSWLLQCNIC